MNLSMNEATLASLKEATRLTQSGQLHEATAMIQRALGGVSSPDNSGAEFRQAASDETTRGETIEGSCRVVEESDTRAASEPSEKNRDETKAQRESSRFEQTQSGSRRAFGSGQGFGGLGELLRETLSSVGGNAAWSPAPADTLPDGASFKNATFSNHAGSRDYKLYVPSGYQGQSLPLVVMLHGCTQNPDDFAAGTGMNALAEAQPCLVLYPAQPNSANHSKCWNWFKASDQQREQGEPAIIAGMTRKVLEEYHVDKRRVYVAGLSAGGAMATTLAMTYPDLYAAVGVHSGLPHGAAQDLPSALAAMQGGSQPLAGLNRQAHSQGSSQARAGSSKTSGIPAIIFHGDRDTTVHPSNGDRIAAQCLASVGVKKSSGAAADVAIKQDRVPDGHGYTCTVHQNAKGQAQLEQWSIHGAGHAWSGGTSRGSYTDPKGPNASQEMLRFFLSHSKPVA
ncbi:PHB depolymerase family esterase [Halomonas sp. PR-M31]|uniref:extracellular catalytic domain type 1 short-chain-length polyhydroxyalkanoate depolymerase n=1 Tax=Halomonas sp. PR-M31 TaxID=1471202 RepID=UPI000A7FD911|nr:PHB depolymerase family esterase [Halomonas sp. PR-M31]